MDLRTPVKGICRMCVVCTPQYSTRHHPQRTECKESNAVFRGYVWRSLSVNMALVKNAPSSKYESQSGLLFLFHTGRPVVYGRDVCLAHPVVTDECIQHTPKIASKTAFGTRYDGCRATTPNDSGTARLP